ncbi:hypothetical protein [Stagnihabitans tardus]|uniref:Uncharacterized protein n=1 Tax=Stagnihabitans tardus TaxID=2699202 RepID=A0AAE4Y6V8_9RHOB|nr:hypothetical protein [Stagnihabitans tardus]NBZ86214.1 hypothetical protein [Stagnihabitans tardus]
MSIPLSIPLVGPMTRAIERDHSTLYYLLVILLTALVLAVKTWGLVALTLTALAFVPVMFTFLIIIARP